MSPLSAPRHTRDVGVALRWHGRRRDPGYNPFDILPDPDLFGLATSRFDTPPYGSVSIRHSRRRTSPIATFYIHGVGADWTTWTPILQAERSLGLAPADQLLVNLPGFGDSENRAARLDIAEVGEMVLDLSARLGYRKVRLVGHSMGGFLALDIAARHPARVESLHIAAGSYFSILRSIQHPVRSFAYSPTVAATFGVQYLLARAGDAELTLFRLLHRLGVFRPLLFPFAAHPLRLRGSVVRALCEQTNPEGLLLTAANGHGYHAGEQWAKISCPIWAAYGRSDRLVTRRDMVRLTHCRPDARCTVVEDASHLLHIEQPFAVARALDLWTAEDHGGQVR